MSHYQTTIFHSFSLEGVGIHTGNSAKVTFFPAPPNTGIQFKKTNTKNPVTIHANMWESAAF